MFRSLRVLTVSSLVVAASLFSSWSATAGTSLLPLGDGHTTTSGAKKEWVYACKIMAGGGGAENDGPWIIGSSWDPSKKISVQGANSWSEAKVNVAAVNAVRTITTAGVPVGSTTGNFPVATSDPAYQYDRNPNTVKALSISVKIPRTPKLASKPTCLSMGAIGYALNGVAIFNALDGENRDAVAHEIQDACDGHPERTGQYHYHSASRCLTSKATGSSTLIGYALDGFGIYVEKDSTGKLLTNASLDACHGRSSLVMFNGKRQKMYHYVATAEYPYTVGCYRGTPIAETLTQVAQGNGTGSQPRPTLSPGPSPTGTPTGPAPMPSPTGTPPPPRR